MMKNIKDLKNKHNGKACYILGTGPSLTKNIIDNIGDAIVISMSGIVFAKKMWGFEPDYIISVDYKNFSDKKTWNELKKTNAIPIISKWIFLKANQFGYQYTPEQFDWIRNSYLVKYSNKEVWKPRLNDDNDISFDLDNGSYICGTGILDLAIPLAVWMGCKEIYLAGCDCSPNGHYYDHRTDDDDYGPNDLSVISQYKMMGDRLNKEGILIYNLTKTDESCPGIPKIGDL